MHYKFLNKNLLNRITKAMSLSLVMVMLLGAAAGCKKDSKNSGAENSGSPKKTTQKSTTSSKNTKSPSASSTTNPTQSNDPGSTPGSTDSTNPGNTPGQTNNPGQTSNPGQTENPGTVEEEVFDLGGRKIVIGDWTVTDIEDARLASNAESASAEQKAGYQSLKYTEQKYNVDIEFMKFNKGADDFVQAAMAGQYFADAFMTMRHFVFPRIANMGLLLPLDEYIDFENDPLWQSNASASLWQGKHYGLKGQVNYPYQGTWINYDIIERTGVEDPYDLWQQGNWNWETMLDIALEVTDDTDGDGATDQWGINNSDVRYFLYSNGGQVVEYNENTGRYEYALDKPNNIRAIQFWSDLSAVHKVVGPGFYAEFAQGNYAFMFNQLLNGQRVYEGGVTNLGWIPFPNGPDVPSDYVTNMRGDPLFLVFPSNVQDPEKVVKVVAEFRAIWDPSKPYYISDKEAIDIMMDTNHVTGKYRDWNYSAAETIGWDNETMIGGSSRDIQKLLDAELFNKVSSQELSVTAALEAVTSAATELINTKQDATN